MRMFVLGDVALWRRARFVCLASWLVMALTACGGGMDKERRQAIEKNYNDLMAINDPLCLYDGPFPMNVNEAQFHCRDCEKLLDAALVRKDPAENGNGPDIYSLTDFGKSVYQNDADTDANAAWDSQATLYHLPNRTDAPIRTSRPRFCFGRTRLFEITKSLAPMRLGSDEFQSVKIVPTVIGPHEKLFSADLQPLELPCSKAPEPGKPTLCDERLVNFQILSNGEMEIRDDVRYGAWVDER
jgi:hypothetical protein